MTEHSLSENIQGLADGSLADSERHLTLQWIEQSAPCYWRDLALAFVETQILREAALGGIAGMGGIGGIGGMGGSKLTPLPPLPPLRKRSVASAWKWAAAACVSVGAFIAGLSLNFGNGPETVLTHPENGKRLNSLIAEAPSHSRTSAVPPVTGAATGTPPAQPHPSPDVARSAAAVRNLNAAIADSGYEASLMTRFVSQKLDDGGRIIIPVNKVIVRQRAE